MYLVETDNERTEFLGKFVSTDSYVNLVYESNQHPEVDNPLLLMTRFLDEPEVYVVSFSHPDMISTDISFLGKLELSSTRKYIVDRKSALYAVDLKNCVDVGLYNYYTTLQTFDMPDYGRVENLKSVPLMTLIKNFKDTLEFILPCIFGGNIDRETCLFEQDFSHALYGVESGGVNVNRDVYIKTKLGEPSLIDSDGSVHTQYNMYTPTSRPSNRFGGINFSAVDKKKGQRNCFTSRYGDDGAIVMLDYESYHLRLLGTHVGFDLPSESLHSYLGKLYHGKDELTEEEYELSKKITFNLIYGGISQDVRDNVPFMDCTAIYVDKLWEEFNSQGYVNTWFYERKLDKSVYTDPNPYKLFNYVLQNAETENNCMVMKKLVDYVSDKTMQFILYIYDAFLFDVPKKEFGYVKELANIMNVGGNYPVRLYVGTSYGEMKEITI
jgi:hypothetical protein